jgi:hypothetical protein
MRVPIILATVLSAFLLCNASASDQSGYQTGKIVSIQKRSSGHVAYGKSDTPSATTDVYDVVINVDGKDHQCVMQRQTFDPTWAVGREAQVRVKGKDIYIKRPKSEDFKCPGK